MAAGAVVGCVAAGAAVVAATCTAVVVALAERAISELTATTVVVAVKGRKQCMRWWQEQAHARPSRWTVATRSVGATLVRAKHADEYCEMCVPRQDDTMHAQVD